MQLNANSLLIKPNLLLFPHISVSHAEAMFAFIFFVLFSLHVVSECSSLPPFDGHVYSFSFGLTPSSPSPKTYLLTLSHWWESPDHQLITLLTHLALAQNTSSIAVLPPSPPSSLQNRSIFPDHFPISPLQRLQPVITFSDFLSSAAMNSIRNAPKASIPLPSHSQEEYESRLGVLGSLSNSAIAFDLPPVDPERTGQQCDRLPGTMAMVDGQRFVFLDRIHFAHLCTERFLPWWYDVRVAVGPSEDDISNVKHELGEGACIIHISDMLGAVRKRDEVEIERYAREVVDAMRREEVLDTNGKVVLMKKGGEGVEKVIKLLKGELGERVMVCGEKDCGGWKGWWGFGGGAEVFVGNWHSVWSRNVALWRKTKGSKYRMVTGFGEMRKLYRWNL